MKSSTNSEEEIKSWTLSRNVVYYSSKTTVYQSTKNIPLPTVLHMQCACLLQRKFGKMKRVLRGFAHLHFGDHVFGTSVTCGALLACLFLSFKSLNLNPPTFNYFKLHTNPFYKQMNVQFTTDTFRTWNQSISIHFIIQLPNCTTKKVKYIHKNKKYTAFYNTKKTVHGIEYVHNWENHASIDTYSSLSW